MEKGKAGCKAYKITLVSLFAQKPGFDALPHQVPSHITLTQKKAALKGSSHRELLKLNFGIALSNDQKKLELGFNVRVLFLAQKSLYHFNDNFQI